MRPRKTQTARNTTPPSLGPRAPAARLDRAILARIAAKRKSGRDGRGPGKMHGYKPRPRPDFFLRIPCESPWRSAVFLHVCPDLPATHRDARVQAGGGRDWMWPCAALSDIPGTF